MENIEEEQYVSLRMAHGDIEHAIRLLNRAKAETESSIKQVLVQHCVIIYARPFKTSRGKFQKKFTPLKRDSVYPYGNSDHDALIADRDHYVAHGDISESAYNPTLHYWSVTDSFPIIQRPSHLYDHIDPLIDKMLVLCDIVLKFLIDRINVMEASFREKMSLE